MAKKGCHLCTHLLYSLCLLISAVAAVLAAATPFWIKSAEAFPDNNSTYACGVFTECTDASDTQCDIDPYGEDLDAIPINNWRIAAVFLGIAMAILWLSWIISLITCLFCYKCTKLQAPMILVATLCLFAAIMAFSAGMEETRSPINGEPANSEVHCYCGLNVDRFELGDCTFGYGANLVIAATVVTFFTTCLAYKVKDMDDEKGLYV